MLFTKYKSSDIKNLILTRHKSKNVYYIQLNNGDPIEFGTNIPFNVIDHDGPIFECMIDSEHSEFDKFKRFLDHKIFKTVCVNMYKIRDMLFVDEPSKEDIIDGVKKFINEDKINLKFYIKHKKLNTVTIQENDKLINASTYNKLYEKLNGKEFVVESMILDYIEIQDDPMIHITPYKIKILPVTKEEEEKEEKDGEDEGEDTKEDKDEIEDEKYFTSSDEEEDN